MGVYDKYVLPKLLKCACGCKPIRYQRKKVVPMAEGTVLEIGLGDGANLPFYEPAKVEKIYGLEPAQAMRDMAQKRRPETALDLEMVDGLAESIPLADESVDTVLCTYTLCSIQERQKALHEMRRVLRPGGRFIYCEHSLAPDPAVARWQRRLDPYWSTLAGGCSMSQPIVKLIDSAGFKIESLSEMYLPKTPKILGYNVWGSAGC
ncbi:MAG: class I SAM-dependent methyltransferase [Myxococcota bacterium]|nr:class I SAM-dependent methyltransferase [Myxococcota bacterium]